MIRKLYITVFAALALLLLGACSEEKFHLGTPGGNRIVLSIADADIPVSRAAATDAEAAISHLDVLIFDEAGNHLTDYYERINRPIATDRRGTVVLNSTQEDFKDTPNAKYSLYLVANSSSEMAVFEAITKLEDLRSLIQTDALLHLTASNATGAPGYFLMDGGAYTGNNAPADGSAQLVALYTSEEEDINLNVTLRRAAAKIEVYLTQGDNLVFDRNLPTANDFPAGYYIKNLPTVTRVLASGYGDMVQKLTSPTMTAGAYFDWQPGTTTDGTTTPTKIKLTAYAYAYAWKDQPLNQEVRLVVNIPMKVRTGGTDESPVYTEYPNNFYQVPLSKEKVFARNTCYTVSVVVNTRGSEEPSTPVELNHPISFKVQPWKEVGIDIGADTGEAFYLSLNKEEYEIYNTDADSTLTFASSSEITSVTIDSCYFINASSQKISLSKSAGKFVTSDNKVIDAYLTKTEENLNGGITLSSPTPTNKTIRYFKLTVTNRDGLSKSIYIKQYPLEYITHELGYYSYRSDFEGTTWMCVNGKATITGNSNSVTASSATSYYYSADDPETNRQTGAVSWSMGRNNNDFFASKVRTSSNNGGYSIRWATWTKSGSNYTRSNSSSVGLSNPRMYHVQITSTDPSYTLGIPKLNKFGITDSGPDNAVVVSPSFMIASQLGAVYTVDSVSHAGSHCSKYVEVHVDEETGKVYHYDNWRLPTQAEVAIIMQYQTTQPDVMAEVMTGDNYWSAQGLVICHTQSQTYRPSYPAITTADIGKLYFDLRPEASLPTERAIRCIRDAYDKNSYERPHSNPVIDPPATTN